MKRTVRRVVQATATAAGMASSLVLPGTALAATPTHSGIAHEQAPGGTALAAEQTRSSTSAPSMHAFEMPTAHSVPTKRRKPHIDDRPDNDRNNPNHLQSEERADNSDEYHERHNPGLQDRSRAKDSDRRDSDAEFDGPDRHYPSCGDDARRGGDSKVGLNGHHNDDYDSNSGDYRPACFGYHPPRGANALDDDGYEGTRTNRRHDKDYQFTGGLY